MNEIKKERKMAQHFIQPGGTGCLVQKRFFEFSKSSGGGEIFWPFLAWGERESVRKNESDWCCLLQQKSTKIISAWGLVLLIVVVYFIAV